MSNIQKTTARRRRVPPSCVIFIVLVSCIIGAGCLNTVILPVFTNNQIHHAENEGNVSVYFLDVGQGDATLFVADGKTILIDAGEMEMGDRIVSDLKRLGVTRIDLLVATHPHSDHIGGMQKVLAAFPVGQVLDAGLPHPSPLYEHFLETIDRNNIPYRVAEQGQTIEIDPALQISVLSPPAQRFGDDPNTNSVVLRISCGMVDFLMTGDLVGEGEDALVRSSYPLDAEVLKVAHHGSSSSTSPAFLTRVRPEMAVISVGEDNPYGHPHGETMDLLKNRGVSVYRTDYDGTIVVRTDGMSYSVKTETNDRNLWTVPVANGTGRTLPVFTIPSFSIPEPVPLPNGSLAVPWPDLTIPVPDLTIPSFGNATSVVISAVHFNAPGDDRQNLNGEWVQLTNRGDGPVLLAGWTLSDTPGKHPYIFPAFILLPESSVTVCTGSGMMNETALFMGRNEPLWGNNGDVVTLKDAGGNIIDIKS
jgi:beta-lactamase superfamily II metal-dependent hydrolase